MKKELSHLPLESYAARYTEYLSAVERQEFGRRFDVKTYGPTIPIQAGDIRNGSVLDSVRRPTWAMSQMTELLTDTVDQDDLGQIYFSDFYHPGLDALAYSGKAFQAYAFNWAQTYDIHDFTFKQHLRWMQHWENMALNVYKRVFVASPMLKELMTVKTPHSKATVHAVGLPFDTKTIIGLRKSEDRHKLSGSRFDCVYSSRWDIEKNPGFFLNVIEACPHLKFAVCTGHNQLRGTDVAAITKAKALEKLGKLTIFTGLTKSMYLAILENSTVQFNCAEQDWVSFTLLEALAMGCHPLYPNHRSFPETLHYEPSALYKPHDVSDAVVKLHALCCDEPGFYYRNEILGHHDTTLVRIADIIHND